MKNKIRKIFKQNDVRGLEFDSSKVSSGDAFFAVKGEESDGNNYILQAFDQGAAVVFTEDESQLEKYSNKNIIVVDDIRMTLAVAAGIIYPNLPEKLIAVTGTNGKSSVVSYCFQILDYLGIPSASIGTIGIETTKEINEKISHENAGQLTMPDPITFRRNLNELALAGAKIVAFEASSHGIVQKRLGDVMADAAAFTSFSQDHLDYHKNMADYLAAKLQLFEYNIKQDGVAVIPSDIAEKNTISEHLLKYKLSCQVINSPDLNVKFLNSPSLKGRDVVVTRHGVEYQFTTDIIGSFQSNNLLIAAELVSAVTDIDYANIIQSLNNVRAVVGRLERATNIDASYHIFVDYAHTPDALEKSLLELFNLLEAGGSLYVIFGCGGDRDTRKRSDMGRIAITYADHLIVTDDNPRSEDAANIRNQIIAGAEGRLEDLDQSIVVKTINEIGDRKKAIESTIDLLKKNDILLIAGKGHEDYQIIGTVKHPFSDMEVVRMHINSN